MTGITAIYLRDAQKRRGMNWNDPNLDRRDIRQYSTKECRNQANRVVQNVIRFSEDVLEVSAVKKLYYDQVRLCMYQSVRSDRKEIQKQQMQQIEKMRKPDD